MTRKKITYQVERNYAKAVYTIKGQDEEQWENLRDRLHAALREENYRTAVENDCYPTMYARSYNSKKGGFLIRLDAVKDRLNLEVICSLLEFRDWGDGTTMKKLDDIMQEEMDDIKKANERPQKLKPSTRDRR